MDLYAVQYAIPARKPNTQTKKTATKQTKTANQAKTKQPKEHQEVGSLPAMEIHA